jgi:hypothetical protein
MIAGLLWFSYQVLVMSDQTGIVFRYGSTVTWGEGAYEFARARVLIFPSEPT